MPIAEDTTQVAADPTIRFEVRPSLAMELVWALMLHDGEPDPANYPIRAERFAASPGMEDRIRSVWSDDYNCFTELFVVAERGGVLFETDPDRFFAGLEAGAVAEPRFEAFESETPEDQVRFRARVARLHDEPDVRDRWLAVVKEAWVAVADGWLAEGRAADEAYEWELKGRFAQNPKYSALEGLVESDFNGMLPRLVRQYAAEGKPVVVNPAWFGRCCFVVSLDEMLVIGRAVPARPIGPTAETRGRARRFKALGDPTRLAILEATACRPRTVGELAAEMGVAQPTVSNHVRLLRESGLLVQAKDGARRLEPSIPALTALVKEALYAVAPSGASITGLD